ncbi:hypothetical protein [Kineococcus terrestris]|uniref:hypothetical protein n=1 Tax=Kineococcus terrestris TaxID=2044856 RepID=UPI0034DAC4E5
MRWDELFADLSGRAAQAEREDLEAEVADRALRDAAEVGWTQRVLASRGEVALQLRDGSWLEGPCLDAGDDWVLLRAATPGAGTPPRQVLVPAAAVALARGVERFSLPTAGAGGRPRPLLLAVRALLGPEPVLVRTFAQDVRGCVARVGRDHLDVSGGPPGVVPPGGARGAVTTVPFAALLSVEELPG